MYLGVMLFRCHMCVWYTRELQVMTLFVTLEVDMSVDDVNPKHSCFKCQVCTCTQLHVRDFYLKRVACVHNSISI